MEPIPTPASTQTAARTAIHTRSFLRIVASVSVVGLKDSNMIHRLKGNLFDPGFAQETVPPQFFNFRGKQVLAV
jgi:hypothetical protein